MKREVRWIYLTVLRKDGTVCNLKNRVAMYDSYNELMRLVRNDKHAPYPLKILPEMKMPLYLKWIKRYLV